MILAIVDRDRGGQPAPDDVPVWRTCVRDVSFSQAAAPIEGAAPALLEGDAYGRLLEILCGLRSPMVGETEVMGQFKAFLAALPPEHGWLGSIGQRLLADARDVRTAHLQGLGSRSYGSVVRRHLGDARLVALIGSGVLAESLLPFLDDEGRAVEVWGRRPAAPFGGRFRYRQLGVPAGAARPGVPAVVVVAAPASSDAIEAVAAFHPMLRRVIDLRGEPGHLPLRVPRPVITLRDVFAEFADVQARVAERVDCARAEIARRASAWERRTDLRPFGWDDLCA
jgi:glutamyl-tRNA reductase